MRNANRKDERREDGVFAEPAFGSPDKAIGFVLWRVMHRYVRELDRALAPLDLTHLQFTVLALAAWLTQSDEQVSQSRLARFGDIHPMQVSNVLKALEAKAMVLRAPDPDDTRSKIVTVTKCGRDVLREAFPIAVDVQHDLFGDAGQPGGALHEQLLAIDRSD